MRIPPHLLDEIRARLPVSQIVGQRVRLKRAGREFIGLSPFKAERTPSFTVNDHKGFYHCFASGEHGDIFTFLMKAEGLSFMEAVERLASQAGVELPAPSPADAQREDRIARLRLALEEACRFFERSLAGNEGEAARDYLARRGVTATEIAAFRLGFGPASRNALRQHLSRAGFTDEEMAEAGLLIHGPDIAVPYDRFRGRVIFPIRDQKDRVIAFGGRALSPDQQPKYLNSSDTLLFHKGQVLYNFGPARRAAHDAKELVVAEGYMDVIALSRAGMPYSVAPLGTALTIEQIRLMWSIVPEPTLCFDGDEAGRKAAFRAIDTVLSHLEPGKSLRFAFLPPGQDPDDLVRSGGAEAIGKVLSEAAPLINVLWRREKQRHTLDTPEQRAAFEDRLRSLAALIGHQTVRYHYQSAFRERLREAFPYARPRQNGPGTRSFGKRPGEFRPRSDAQIRVIQPGQINTRPREALILTALLNHPWLMDEHAEDIATLPFEDPDHERLCKAMLAAHVEREGLDKAALETQLLSLGLGHLLRRLGESVTHKSDQQFLAGTPEQEVVAGWHHITALQRREVALKIELEDAERAYFDNQTDENFERLRLLKEQAAHISRG